jgi:hypothetical protein
MFKASNLGQILGRALYGELPPKPQPALVDAAEAARREAEQRQAVERERAARDEAARREQERSLDRARAAKIREEDEAARAAAEERRAATVAARKRKATKAPPAPHRIGTSSAIRELLAKHPGRRERGDQPRPPPARTCFAIATPTRTRCTLPSCPGLVLTDDGEPAEIVSLGIAPAPAAAHAHLVRRAREGGERLQHQLNTDPEGARDRARQHREPRRREVRDARRGRAARGLRGRRQAAVRQAFVFEFFYITAHNAPDVALESRESRP